jgi:hypothetical protein
VLRFQRGERFAHEAGRRATAARASDGDYLLRLIAFEILLKAVGVAHGTRPKKNHSYAEFFSALPRDAQQRVLDQAQARVGKAVDYTTPEKLLKVFQRNFVALRYSYEAYDRLTADELKAREKSWLENGARIEDATFTYYPEELFGLLFALGVELERAAGDLGSAGISEATQE